MKEVREDARCRVVTIDGHRKHEAATAAARRPAGEGRWCSEGACYLRIEAGQPRLASSVAQKIADERLLVCCTEDSSPAQRKACALQCSSAGVRATGVGCEQASLAEAPCCRLHGWIHLVRRLKLQGRCEDAGRRRVMQARTGVMHVGNQPPRVSCCCCCCTSTHRAMRARPWLGTLGASERG